MEMKTKDLVLIAVLAALICVMAPFSVPIGAVPLSLATLAVYVVSSVTDVKHSLAAVCVYILLGAVGVPVFSGFQGGLQKLVGLTGGYIFGYIPCALVIGLMLCRWGSKKWMWPVSMIAGTAVLYAFGTAWFVLESESTLVYALSVCVLPFLIGDGIKIVAASLVAPILRRRITR